MKSLAERHIDRAQRKADNKVESTNGNYGGNVGAAAVAITAAQEAFGNLNDEQREELRLGMRGTEDGFMSSTTDAYGGAFDGEGNLRNAGIGVVNPLLAPTIAAKAIEEASDGFGAGGDASGWGKAAESTIAEGSNAGGEALERQANGTEGTEGIQNGTEGAQDAGATGWGAQPPKEKPPVAATMKVAELEKIAAAEGVDLTGVTNNEGRVSAIEAKRNAA